MAGPIKLNPFIIESDAENNELLIKNTINDEDVLITPDGISNDSVAEDNAVRELLPEGEQDGLDAASTGIKYEGETLQYIDSSLASDERAAYLEVATSSSADDETVSVELYDYSQGSVLASQDVTGGTKRTRSGEIGDSLEQGNEIGVRFNVTSASGTAGATFDAITARLMVK